MRVGKRAIVILPNEDVDLGVVGPGETIMTEVRQTALGPVFRAYRTKAPPGAEPSPAG